MTLEGNDIKSLLNISIFLGSRFVTLFILPTQGRCQKWQEQGECDSNRGFMEDTCKKSCKLCAAAGTAMTGLAPVSNDFETNLAALAKKLKEGGGVEQIQKEVSQSSHVDPDTKAQGGTSVSPVTSPSPPPPVSSPPPPPSPSPPPPPPPPVVVKVSVKKSGSTPDTCLLIVPLDTA